MSPINRREAPRLREDVRIRLGEKIEVVKDGQVQRDKEGNPKTKPVALKTFRFTAQRRELIDRAAKAWGGEVRPWEEPATQDRWQLTSDAEEIECLIPPAGGFSQWNELWKGGGCERRCDGITLFNAGHYGAPCACPEDGVERAELAKQGKACKERTRIVVILPQLGELVGARVETGSYYAAGELAFVQALFEGAMAQGVFIPAKLRIAARRIKRPGQAGRNFTVVEFISRIADAMEAIGTTGDKARALEAGTTNDGPPALEKAREIHTRRAAAKPPAPQERPAAAGDPRPTPAAGRPANAEQPAEDVEAVAQAFHQAGLREDEAAQVVGLFTNGRTKNLKTLDDGELRAVMDIANRLRGGTLELVFDGDKAQLVDREGNAVVVDVDGERNVAAEKYSGTWWAQQLRGSGITQGSLLRRARALAGDTGAEVPKAIDEITDERVAAPLAAWLESERVAKAS